MHLIDTSFAPVCHRLPAAAAVLCICLTAACGRSSDPASAPPPPGPDVWAVVDDRQISREDVERVYRRMAPPSPTPSEEEAYSAKLEILDELIVQDILLERARVQKVEVTDAEVETAFTDRWTNMQEGVYEKELQQRNLTPEDMKRHLHRELVVQRLLQHELGTRISISDDEVRKFYEQNRGQFNVPETRHRIAQIIVTPVRDHGLRNRANDDATSPAEAQRKLQMLMERLKSGADFADLAFDYSEDPQTAAQGGDLGFIPASALTQVPPQLRQAVLKLKPGEVTTISAGGAHTLILLVAREEAGQRDLSSPGIKEGITDLLRGRREQMLGAAYVAAARNDADVVNYLARQLLESERAMPGLAPSRPGGS